MVVENILVFQWKTMPPRKHILLGYQILDLFIIFEVFYNPL